MSDPSQSQFESRYYDQGIHFFVNNCLGSFFRGTLNWFADQFYPRINYRVIGTYEKSVEYFTKKKTHGHEIDKNILPSLTLDPAYEFQPEERGGKFLWQYPHLMPGLGRKLFNSIKPLPTEQSIDFTPVFTRYEGAFDLIFWLHSVYELFDFRVFLLQFCGGYGRYIRPTVFDSNIIVPEDLVDYTYTDADGNERNIDWTNTDLEIKLIDNTAKYHYVLPVLLNPIMKLVSLSDSSDKYGGDTICQYKLTATFEYEIELPTYFVVTPWVKDIKFNANVSVGSTYSRYGLMPIYNPVTKQYEQGNQLPSYHRMTEDTNVESNMEIKDFTHKFVYSFTEEDEDSYKSDEWFSFPNPIPIEATWENTNIISYHGIMSFGQQWKLSDDETQILIDIEPLEGEIIEIFLYL